MSLKAYRNKRDFKKTPEPLSSHAGSGAMRFCIQEHHARRLHYDFRLEYQGILLSWAVPKGPSLDPHDKRLAIKVEDHPLDYQYFEGVIPKGNYGAGKVEIWDHGLYCVPQGNTRVEIEKYLKQGLKEGHFSVILTGEKLQGEFVFQKLKKDVDDTAWLLIKKEDEFSTSENAIQQANPVEKIKKNKSSKLPEFIPPMLATLVDAPFTDEEWLFEIKWDGYRALSFIDGGKVALKSRNKLLFNKRFPRLIRELESIDGQIVLDGEVVILDAAGKPQFQLMQNYQKEHRGTLMYYVFDLLFKDGEDLRSLPLIERKEILKKFLKQFPLASVRYCDHIVKRGVEFFRKASKAHLEGIIGKKMSSTYQSRRSSDWVKIKTSLRQEVVIGGFTEPRGSRKKFGSLLVGLYNNKKELIYAGHVGGGFDTALLNDVYKKLHPLIQTKSPFKNIPKGNAKETWVKPKLLCEVSFTEWTGDHVMRHPIFHGLREDKKPETVQEEIPQLNPKKKSTQFPKETQENEIGLSNLEKIYWPKEKYTKGDLIDYYRTIAPFILPYLKDRPIMLHRYPNGIDDKDFYQKNLQFPPPAGIKTFPVNHDGKVDNYLLINDLNSLLFAVNLGSIDLHPFMSRCEHLDNPDYCVIDLDPHGVSFDKVVEVALVIHEILDQIKAKHYCKTSGGNGLHILIPLHAKYSTEQSKQFAQILGHYVHTRLPKTTSLERDPKKRPKKIYIDCLQNRYGQTIVAPYSVRPRPEACVSTPLVWEEVNTKLSPSQFTIKTIPKRVRVKGDLLLPILKSSVNLNTALSRLKKFV